MYLKHVNDHYQVVSSVARPLMPSSITCTFNRVGSYLQWWCTYGFCQDQIGALEQKKAGADPVVKWISLIIYSSNFGERISTNIYTVSKRNLFSQMFRNLFTWNSTLVNHLQNWFNQNKVFSPPNCKYFEWQSKSSIFRCVYLCTVNSYDKYFVPL